VAIMQPKATHFAFFNDETVLQVHGVGPWQVNYVNPEDDPRKKIELTKNLQIVRHNLPLRHWSGRGLVSARA